MGSHWQEKGGYERKNREVSQLSCMELERKHEEKQKWHLLWWDF